MLRTFILFLLIICLMDPCLESSRTVKRPHFFIGLDPSKSVNRKDLLEKLKDYRKGLDQKDLPGSFKLDYFFMEEGGERLSNYEEAIQRLGSRSLDESKLVGSVESQKSQLDFDEYPVFFLFTDGNETDAGQERLSDWVYQDLYWIPISTNRSDSFFLESLDIPTEILKGRPIPISLISNSRQVGKARIRVSVNSVTEREMEIDLQEGLNFSFASLPERDVGTYRIVVEVFPSFADENLGNQNIEREIKIYEPDRILVLESSEKGGFLQGFLAENGYHFERKDPAQIEADLSLSSYSAVLIHDVLYETLGDDFGSKLEDFVLQGGGLGYLGGRSSFGPGGYYKTPVEKALPVYMPPRSYRKSVALFFVIDSSGSMISEDKSIWSNPLRLMQFRTSGDRSTMPIHIARESAKQLISELIGLDIAVVHFNDRAMLAVPLQTVTPGNLDSILRGVDSIEAGGGTRFYPAIKGAMTLLYPGAYSEVKMLFLSDGTPMDKDKIPLLLEEVREAGIELSTIAFGSGADFELLREMAEGTGGRAYLAEETSQIQRAFEDAVEQVFGPPIVDELRPVAWVENQGFLEESSYDLPDIHGFVSTTPKQRAQMVWVSESGDPLFGIWRYGLGRSFAWTSDLSGNWSRNYLNWDRFRALLDKGISSILRKKNDSVKSVVSRKGSEIRVLLRALSASGEYIENLKPQGSTDLKRVSFQSLGEGEYLGVFKESRPGDHLLKLEGDLGDTKFQRNLPYRVPLGIEESFHHFNRELKLVYDQNAPQKLLSEAHRVAEVMRAFRVKTQRDLRSFALLFLGLAIFFFCIDVLFRRLRVLEGIHDSENEEDKIPRLAEHSLKHARLALNRGDLQEAERHYLNAHRYFQTGGMKEQAQGAWEEFRLKIK